MSSQRLASPTEVERARWAVDVARIWGLNVLLAAIWFVFAEAHFRLWLESGDLRGLGTVAIETVVAVLFVVRRPPLERSGNVVAWAATVVGTLGPMLMRPTAGGGGAFPMALQLAGAAFAVGSLLTLGRSFGLVAANRGIVVRGPYRLVRHPAYLGYLVAQCGYVLENPSLRNAAILTGATAGQLVRIRFEEQVLSHDGAYDAYKRRVRYRLIPRVY